MMAPEGGQRRAHSHQPTKTIDEVIYTSLVALTAAKPTESVTGRSLSSSARPARARRELEDRFLSPFLASLHRGLT
jgi:hypothetical protein